MLVPLAALMGLTVPKFIFILLAVVAGIAFLMILGAFALGSALALIASLTWIARLPARAARGFRRLRPGRASGSRFGVQR